MAMRYLATKIAIPSSLRRASAPRTSRPLSSRSHQDGHNNGARVDGARKTLTYADLDRCQAEFEAQCEAIEKEIRDRQRNWRVVIWSGAAGFGCALLVIGHSVYEEKKRARRFRFDY